MDSLRDEVSDLLLELSQVLRKRSYSAGLKPAQWAVLRYLERSHSAGQSTSDFAAHHKISVGSAAQTISSLQSRELVESSPDPQDGRRRVLRLTPKGRALLREDPYLALHEMLAEQPLERLWATRQAAAAIIHRLLQREPPRETDAGSAYAAGEVGIVQQRNHDLRELITTIAGMAELIERQEGSAPTAKLNEYAAAIRTSSLKLLDLLQPERDAA